MKEDPGSETRTVSAVRYSNPMMSMTIDLTSLAGLGNRIVSEDEDSDASTPWPAAFAEYRRSRLRPGHQETFGTNGGYSPINAIPVLKSTTPAYFPVRVIPGTGDSGFPTVFLVDAGGPGTVRGLRGQVLRVILSDPDNIISDERFDGVR